MFFSPFCIAITSLGEERANLSAFPTFVRFVLVWICRFPLPLGVWEGLRFVIVALPGLFSYLLFDISASVYDREFLNQKESKLWAELCRTSQTHRCLACIVATGGHMRY